MDRIVVGVECEEMRRGSEKNEEKNKEGNEGVDNCGD